MTHTHGKSGTSIYNIWILMKHRCNNPADRAYPRYGGRGIKVCQRWLNFENFYADVGDPPAGMWLDREENDGDYEPANCRWVTPKDQNRNRSTNRLLCLGRREMTVAEWAEMIGIKSRTIRSRIDLYGWSVRRALTTPVQIKEVSDDDDA